MSKVKHNDTCKMAFGRLSEHTNCPRCEELKAGAKPRQGWGSNRNQYNGGSSLKAYCFSVPIYYSRCTKETNPKCACGRMSYTN